MSESIGKAAGRVLHAIWKEGCRYKKAGVMLLDLAPASRVQSDLWTAPDGPRSKTLMKVMDGLNAHYGRDTLAFASAGRRKVWKMRREHHQTQETLIWGAKRIVQIPSTGFSTPFVADTWSMWMCGR